MCFLNRFFSLWRPVHYASLQLATTALVVIYSLAFHLLRRLPGRRELL